MPTAAEIDRTDQRINRIGSDLFFDPVTLATAAAHGIEDPFVLYAGGRAGAMGDVTAAAVQSAFGFFSPEAFGALWPTVLETATPSRVTEVLLEGMHATARQTWSPDAAAVVADVGGRVVDAVPMFGLALFSGWRSLPRPADAQGAAAVVVMTLRELRGDVNLQEVAAGGLAPIEAELSHGGVDRARLHGWPEPYPDVTHLADVATAVSAATSRRMHEIYGRLPDADLDRFVDAVEGLRVSPA